MQTRERTNEYRTNEYRQSASQPGCGRGRRNSGVGMNTPVDYSATVPLDVFAADLAKTCRKWFRISEDGDQAGSDRHQSIAHEIIEGTAEFINELKGPLTVEVWSVTIENPSNDIRDCCTIG